MGSRAQRWRGKGNSMKRTRALAVASALLLGGAVMAASPAGADPQAETFELTCTNDIPEGTITANSGNGLWTPGFAQASTGVYIVYAATYTATFTAEGQDPVDLPPAVFVKKAPNNTKTHLHGVCTFTGSEDLVNDPDLGTGHIEFAGEVSVFWTGK